ncbi:hypothetical protein [Pengzhenrongella sp.]|jgi:hypothetical protein|uniref:hypothetical protein n=1 Tax=Pengzhenrongella sp. TaxID=2888820 RepID=UPI002F94B814
MVDIAWEGVPNWIAACASALTLGAALVAGYFASKAAHWTKKQAEATDAQVKIEQAALEVAREDAQLARDAADSQRAETDRANRRLEESRLDQLAPVIFARAIPGGAEPEISGFDHTRDDGSPYRTGWQQVGDRLEVPKTENEAFRFTIKITFENISSLLARIDIIDATFGEMSGPQGEFSVQQGEAFYLAPSGKREIVWTRQIGSQELSDSEPANSSRHAYFGLRFLVRDVGMNVGDVYAFGVDLHLRHFNRDGTRLIVKRDQAFLWTEIVAEPTARRLYGRLDAASGLAATSSP